MDQQTMFLVSVVSRRLARARQLLVPVVVCPRCVAVVALALSRQRSVPPTLISAASTPPAAPTARSVLLVTRRAG